MLSPMSGGSWMDEVGRNAFNKPFFTPSTRKFDIILSH